MLLFKTASTIQQWPSTEGGCLVPRRCWTPHPPSQPAPRWVSPPFQSEAEAQRFGTSGIRLHPPGCRARLSLPATLPRMPSPTPSKCLLRALHPTDTAAGTAGRPCPRSCLSRWGDPCKEHPERLVLGGEAGGWGARGRGLADPVPALGQQGPRREDRRPGFQATVTLPLVIPGQCGSFLELLGW